MIHKTRLFFFLLAILSLNVFGQSGNENDHEEHDHHRHEVGMGNSAVYFFGKELFGYSLHLHYTYNFPESRFGIGGGYEIILSDERHHMVGLTVIYRPVERLNINLTPGIAFEGGGHPPGFALHLEATYEFQFNSWHLGPTISCGYDPEDLHIGLGVHLGYGF